MSTRAVARAEPASADLRHVDTWLFDLDNTLYPLSSGLGEAVSARITEFVVDLTGLAVGEAHALQKRYLTEHGLTLRGLMLHHDVDPDVYHAWLNATPIDGLDPDPVLATALARLPGRRLVFTNADEVHARRVLEKLELAGLFDAVFHIGSGGYHPKPALKAFESLIDAFAIEPAAAAFFDDAAHNLAPAAALGMTTVLVGDSANQASCADHLAPDLASFLAAARLKETP